MKALLIIIMVLVMSNQAEAGRGCSIKIGHYDDPRRKGGGRPHPGCHRLRVVKHYNITPANLYDRGCLKFNMCRKHSPPFPSSSQNNDPAPGSSQNHVRSLSRWYIYVYVCIMYMYVYMSFN